MSQSRRNRHISRPVVTLLCLLLSWPPCARLARAADKEAERTQVKLRSGNFKPALGLSSELSTRLRRTAAARQTNRIVVCVMFNVPLQRESSAVLRAAGATVLGHCPPNTSIVSLPDAALTALAAHPAVRSVFQLQPQQKIEPNLRRRLQAAAGETIPVVLYLHDSDADGQVRRRLEKMGFEVLASHPDIRALRGRCAPSALSAILADEQVAFAEEESLNRCLLNTSVRHCNAVAVRDHAPAPYGSNIIMGVIDSGLVGAHDCFNAQSGYPMLNALGHDVSGDAVNNAFVDPIGHGSAVLSVIASRWKSADRVGVCPWLGGTTATRLEFYKTGRLLGGPYLWNTDVAISNITRRGVCRVVNCSWGNTNAHLGNDLYSRLIDRSTWSNGTLWVCSAGNNGHTVTIHQPAACKNCLAVGSVTNSCSLGIAWDSSFGPTTDGRFKPEIYAPGQWVSCANAANEHGAATWSGTSFAAPHVSAIAATLMDHFPELRTRPAALKALLIASAKHITNMFGDVRAGLVDSAAAHGMSGSTTGAFFYSDTLIEQDHTNTWYWTVPAGYDDLYAALCWVEPPAAESASETVVCDYDLAMFNGTIVQQAATSKSRVDNLEFCHLQWPEAGTVRLEVSGMSVPGDPSVDARIGLAVFARKQHDKFSPCPNPAGFMVRPYLSDDYTISMRAFTPDTESTPLYYFEELTGNPGGDSSGWIESFTYSDAGLSPNRTYGYRVKTGEMSDDTNETAFSETVWLCADTNVTPLVHDVALADEAVSNVYSFEVHTDTWSAVGLAPETSDHDLFAADNPGMTNPYAASRLTGTTRDFIVVNGAKAGDGLHFAQVTYGASSAYGIETVQDSPTLAVNGDSLADSITSADIVRMYQAAFQTGELYRIYLDMTNGSADVSVWLFSSTRYSGSRELGSYDAGADAAGGGGDENFSYLAAEAGLHGILVVNGNEGNGEYTMRVACDTDSDSDKLPDAWEREYGSLSYFSDSGDYDQDGFMDWEELSAGTSPTDGTDYLKMLTPEAVPGGTNCRIRWQSSEGRRYSLCESTNLPFFSAPIATNLSATPPTNEYNQAVAPSPTPRFYRIDMDLSPPAEAVVHEFKPRGVR